MELIGFQDDAEQPRGRVQTKPQESGTPSISELLAMNRAFTAEHERKLSRLERIFSDSDSSIEEDDDEEDEVDEQPSIIGDAFGWQTSAKSQSRHMRQGHPNTGSW